MEPIFSNALLLVISFLFIAQDLYRGARQLNRNKATRNGDFDAEAEISKQMASGLGHQISLISRAIFSIGTYLVSDDYFLYNWTNQQNVNFDMIGTECSKMDSTHHRNVGTFSYV